MYKFVAILMLVITHLNAQGISPEQLSSIYKEAVLFVIVFGTMGILSYIISKKNADKYAKEHPKKQKKDIKKEENYNVDKLLQLSDLLEKGMVSKEEFLHFKKMLLNQKA